MMDVEHTKAQWIEKRFGYLTKTCKLDPGPAIRRATEEWYEATESELCAELTALVAAVERVQALHTPWTNPIGEMWCRQCTRTYPCSTIRALEMP